MVPCIDVLRHCDRYGLWVEYTTLCWFIQYSHGESPVPGCRIGLPLLVGDEEDPLSSIIVPGDYQEPRRAQDRWCNQIATS